MATQASLFKNIGAHVGDSKASAMRTAMGHFNGFLRMLNESDPEKYPHTEFQQIPPADFLNFRDIFGQFPSYIQEKTNVSKGGTTLNYVTQIKDAIQKINRESDILGPWYTTLRSNVEGEYRVQCALNGEKYSDSAPAMTREDSIYIAKVLFRQNTNESLMDRDLLNNLRHTMGRVTEIAHIQCKDYSLYKGNGCHTLSVHVKRSKTGVEQDITMFTDRDNYLICPIHSLATLCAVTSCSASPYPQVFEKNEANHVNRMLTRISEGAKEDDAPEAQNLTEDMTSHGGRRAAATIANEHLQIQPTWIIQRGGWTLGRLEQIFAYITGTRKTDSRVGRVLAGWADPDYGGCGLTIEAIPIGHRDLFRWFAIELLGAADFPEQSKAGLQELLCCTLLLHYEEVLADFPESKLIERMQSTSRVTKEVLLVWATSVRKFWVRQNSRFLPLDSMEVGDVS
jgi:hypothetical protein